MPGSSARSLAALAALGRVGAATTRDRDALLRGACDVLVDTLGLAGAAIDTLLPNGDVERAAEAGVAPDPARATQGREPVVARDGSVVVPVWGEHCLALIACSGGDTASLAAFADVLGGFLEHALEHEREQRLGDLKSHFIALASHELRAPVAVVHGVGMTLVARARDLDPARVGELHAILAEQTTHLAHLVQQLLDLSRLDADAIHLQRESIDVRDRVEEIVRTVVGDGAAAIEIDVDPTLTTLVDPTAFERIVSNLVTNAVRYGAAPICVGAQQRDTHFRLTVEDHGRGVAEEFVPRLFERFTRGDAAPKATGSGLGLAIAKSYANAHGGELLYRRAEPTGARFELALPRPHPGER